MPQPPQPPLDLISSICEFLASEGFRVTETGLPEPSFLPGVTIRGGTLFIDRTRLLSPGDILHEAGHLALLPSADRAAATSPLPNDGGMEMGAIAWSYAAALHLEIPLEVLFHPQGYKGDSQSLIENFSAGRYIGVPMLEWTGLTATGQAAQTRAVAPYPAMLRWKRD